MDLHIKKYQTINKSQNKSNIIHFEVEENKSFNQSHSHKIDIDKSSTTLQILENKKVKMLINPFRNEHTCCQICFRGLCAITIIILTLVIISIIVYK